MGTLCMVDFFFVFKLLVSLYKQFFKAHIATDLSVGERRDLLAAFLLS